MILKGIFLFSFMKDAHPPILNVILTNGGSLLFNVINFTWGISNWYNIILGVIKGAALPPNKRKSKCRSYKHFYEKLSVRQWVSSLLMTPMFLMSRRTSTGLMKSSMF